MRPGVAEGRLRGLLHDVAHLSRENQTAFPGHGLRLDVEYLPSHRSPSQAGRDSNPVPVQPFIGQVALNSKVSAETGGSHDNAASLSQGEFHSGLATQRRNFPLEIAKPGFAGITAD